MKIQDLSRIGFDTFQRYKKIADILSVIHTYEKNESLSILDVGGYPCEFEKFTKNKIFIVDLPYCKKENYIKGSGMDLPIKTNFFDIVISSDTFEHIVVDKRIQFLKELIRVSKKYIILGAPFKSEINELVEDELCNLHNKIYQKPHPWLNEHKVNSLPNLSILMDFLDENNYLYQIFPNGNSFIWYLFQWAYYLFQSLSGLAEYTYKINSLYNNYLYHYDNIEPSYRKIILISKDNQSSDIINIANEIRVITSVELNPSDTQPFIIMTNILSDVINQINLLRKTGDASESFQTLIQYIDRLESVLENNTKRLESKPKKHVGLLKKLFGQK